jgi:hypothetical protein
MLSQLPGHRSAGELVHLWERGVERDELCGCGEPFRRCPFWSEVGRAAFGGWDRLDVESLLALKRRVDRNRYIFFMLVPIWPRYRRDLRRYREILSRLYGAVGSVGGGAVVVDSSKHASTAFLLKGVPGVRLRILHLVRDSRGVTYSLLKTVRRPEVVGRDEFMHRSAPWKTGSEWLTFNLLFHVLGLLGTRTSRLRYEDLVRAPSGAIAVALGGKVSERDLAFIQGTRVRLGLDHTVAGNPMRMRTGEIELQVDDEWRQRLGPHAYRIANGLTWPLLLRYGYLGRGRR